MPALADGTTDTELPAPISRGSRSRRLMTYSVAILLVGILATWLLNVFDPSDQDAKRNMAQRALAMRAHTPAFSITSDVLFEDATRGSSDVYEGKVVQLSFKIENLAIVSRSYLNQIQHPSSQPENPSIVGTAKECRIGCNNHQPIHVGFLSQPTELSCDIIAQDISASQIRNLHIGQDITIKGIYHYTSGRLTLGDSIIVSN